LNLYEDLISKTGWNPYVSAFKQTFRLWESDYKYRWDICKEVADIMEFEFYADNFGAINYHPPFYNWNPANVKYFIENKEIISESHAFSETNVITSVEIVSQPQLGLIDNIAKILSTFVAASPELVQRYGFRFRTKNIPVLSGTERNENPESGELSSESIVRIKKPTRAGLGSEITRTARLLYGRAWLNRRNYEVQSATVEIPGTPEYYLCNVVAFVDDINETIQKMALETVGQTVTEASLLQSLISPVTPIHNINVGARAKKESGSEIVDNFKVYYISGITHKYQQGGNFTTTLTLTHGRRWKDKFDVGYSFSEEDHEKLLDVFRKYIGQKKETWINFRDGIDFGLGTVNIPPVLACATIIDKPLSVKSPLPVEDILSKYTTGISVLTEGLG